MKLFRTAMILGLVALAVALATPASAQTMAVGTYRGTGTAPNGNPFHFEVEIEQAEEGGVLRGTNTHYAGYQSCRAKTELTGTVKGETVELEARGGIKDCYRKWVLKFAGTDELAGVLSGPSGTFQVTLKKK